MQSAVVSDLDDVNTLDETAGYLKISPDALARLARARKIGTLKQGRALTFTRAAILEYIEGNATPAIAPNPHGLTDRAWARIQREGGKTKSGESG